MGLSKFIGQERIKRMVRFEIELARKKSGQLNHMLICGADGEGKTRLVQCIADGVQVPIKESAAGSFQRVGDVAAALTNLHQGDLLLLTHIEEMNPSAANVLGTALENVVLDIIIGKGPSARSLRVPLPRFTVIGTAPHLGAVREPLKASFRVLLEIEPYDINDLVGIISVAAGTDKPELDISGAIAIAERADGSLKTALSVVRRVRDYALVNNHPAVNEQVVIEAFGQSFLSVAGRDQTGRSFEHKCMDLLRRRGLEVQLTGRTGDGGIDIIAKSRDPIAGGKYIVQCKDWANPVGAPVVRDLYGVVHAEDANRGILITSSSFTPEATRFAAGKRLELIDGTRLDYIIGRTE
jgi:Holliday junction DNA helicase RuvB